MDQVKSRTRVRKFGEVFTAQREVEAMCDLLPPEMYEPGATYLEPCCGEGVFLLEVLRRKFRRCHSRADYSKALASVWGMDIQADNVANTIKSILELAREHFRPTKADEEVLMWHIIQCDSLKVMRLLAEMRGTSEKEQSQIAGGL